MDLLKDWDHFTRNDGTKLYQTRNDLGIFLCDETGALIGFEPSSKNKIDNGTPSWHKNCLHSLIFPEGITSICADLFRDNYIIVGHIRFPRSLRSIGECAFHSALIMELELPDTLEEIKPAAFMHCYIHTLRLSPNMPAPEMGELCHPVTEKKLHIWGRQFKETSVDTLIAPEGYPYKMLMLEANIAHVKFFGENQ